MEKTLRVEAERLKGIIGGVNVKKKEGGMEEKDREIWIGESSLYLGEDNILYGTVVGEQTEKMPFALKEAIDKMKNIVEGRVNVLIDLNKAGQLPSGARKIGRETLKDEKVGKVALFGLHPVAWVIASFVMGVTRKKDMRFFKTKEQALAWLKE